MNPEYFSYLLYPEKLETLFDQKCLSFTASEKKSIKVAVDFAQKKHSLQRRDEGTPYISHCILAAIIACDQGGKAEDIITLLLHDTLEDTDSTYEEILGLFGEDIADNVRALSHSENGIRMSMEEYVARLLARPSCLFHKSCDRIANLYSTYVQPLRAKKLRMIKTTEEFFYPLLEKDHPSLVAYMREIIAYLKAHPLLTKPFKKRIKELQLITSTI